MAYFVGEALWTYLNTPFLYTYEGFLTEEIPAIQVENETWRRLKVTFPDSVKSHTREQISCFGPDGLLRRHDYTAGRTHPPSFSCVSRIHARVEDGYKGNG